MRPIQLQGEREMKTFLFLCCATGLMLVLFSASGCATSGDPTYLRGEVYEPLPPPIYYERQWPVRRYDHDRTIIVVPPPQYDANRRNHWSPPPPRRDFDHQPPRIAQPPRPVTPRPIAPPPQSQPRPMPRAGQRVNPR